MLLSFDVTKRSLNFGSGAVSKISRMNRRVEMRKSKVMDDGLRMHWRGECAAAGVRKAANPVQVTSQCHPKERSARRPNGEWRLPACRSLQKPSINTQPIC